MQTIDLVVIPKWILSMDDKQTTHVDHAIAVDKGNILSVAPLDQINQHYIAKQTVHRPHHVVLPGFVNAHTHTAMNLLRGLCDDIALMDWLNQYIWPAEKKWLSPAFIRDGMTLAIAEMFKSGTTCFNDMYFCPEVAAEVVDELGIRAAIGMTVFDVATPFGQDAADYLKRGIPLFTQWAKHDRIQLTLAPHAIYTTSDHTLSQIKEVSETYHARINMHVQETADEVHQSLAATGKRPLERLDSLGLLSDQFIAVHMTQMTAEEISLSAEKKIHIVHCPESNMKLASGICPAQTLIDAGINVALGTDGAASNNDLDMITEMRSAAFLAKVSTQNPTSLSAHTALAMATRNGAHALGQGHRFGQVAMDMAADFIAIDLNYLQTIPTYHPHSAIVYAADRQQISDVWVAGKQVVKDHELTTIDEEKLRRTVEVWKRKIGG